jgi:hypothetical protein
MDWLDSGAPEDARMAAQAYLFTRRTNSNIVKGMDSRYEAAAIYIDSHIALGENTPRVVKAARDQILSPGNYKEREALYRLERKQDLEVVADSILDSFDDRWYSFILGTNRDFDLYSRMRLEALDLYRVGFLSGLDKEDSKEFAKKALELKFGRTELNDDSRLQIMQEPPELAYPQYKGTGHIKETFLKFIEKVTASYGKEAEPDIRATDKPGVIKTRIGDEFHERTVFIGGSRTDGYFLYWLYDEKNPLTKQQLNMNGDSNTTFDFGAVQ